MRQQERKEAWYRLQQEVIMGGICTHCGTCAGLSEGTLLMQQTADGPLPVAAGREVTVPPLAYEACPGKGIDYAEAFRRLFGELPANWLLGYFRQLYVGYATDSEVRRRGASGGVITQTLLYLLDRELIDGAVVLQQGRPQPWLARPVITRNREEILEAAQSVYVPVPVNEILEQMSEFEGRLAYVGLPDQVASLRCLQQAGHPGAEKVEYVLGPYTGTAIYAEAIESYLQANGVQGLDDIAQLRWREGEWPGHLAIYLRSGRVLRARKFYYNYLIPFYITRASLQAADFSNELTDISVGDAWHPKYESQGHGYSAVIARSDKGNRVLQQMRSEGVLDLQESSVEEALAMHGHMIDFKKRGSFIRNQWRRRSGRPAPSYGYRPQQLAATRKAVEAVIVVLFAVCGTRTARQAARLIPLSILGPLFEGLRRSWKTLSKRFKRRGLGSAAFEPVPVEGH